MIELLWIIAFYRWLAYCKQTKAKLYFKNWTLSSSLLSGVNTMQLSQIQALSIYTGILGVTIYINRMNNGKDSVEKFLWTAWAITGLSTLVRFYYES